jgi:hypothetical protein
MGEFVHETIEFVQTLQRVLLLAAADCFEQRWRGVWRLIVHVGECSAV